ncbi:PREDICTED: speckle targeted PIP5K1A-regulated poly(A) polymerase-like [Habropoda laboriosa]|uniref:speckle targeted PIP5K1A-regulated poly(A) polymerase-like n=1 Tax=Habropoda laboriosa TaxID=597456 RepID=UPI00083D64A8|nr:PREDICTED: speckle targeted PIP5K1A-regulated poly(A) polymerase-like [Habropoda laboriosa]
MSKQCDVCSLYFQDECTLQAHLAGKKHLKKLKQLQVMETSIVVSPLPKFISACKLINFFQQYGTIKQHQFGPQYLKIEFHDRHSVDVLSNKPILINNVKLNIKKGTSYNDVSNSKSVDQYEHVGNADSISYNNIEKIFNENTTFDNQLQMFLNAVQLTDTEIESKYESVCTDLNKIFKVIFPNCKTYKFGSIQTGLGFKECDLDIYMDVRYNSMYTTFSFIQGDPIYEAESASADFKTTTKIFRKVKRVMYKMNYVFSNIISIPRAKTPIIKFYYVPTHVSCDISFKNSLGIYKSSFIKYCISLDSRIKPLIMIIKYWTRHFKISGTGKICNYALVLLTIFYLQQPTVNIIPPMMILRNSCPPLIINGWQVNFDENTVLPPITNQNSIAQLLHGFFLFYASFQFKSQVICPIDGMTHTELEFKEVYNLPSCMDTYKTYVKEDGSLKLNVNKLMCVQDPIELNHNVTACTQYSTLNSFVSYCALDAGICTMSSKDDYRNLMKTLLTSSIKKKPCKGKFIVTISAKRCQYHNDSNNMETSIDTVDKTKLTSSDWYFTVFTILKSIFENIFKVQTEVFTANIGAGQQKIEILSDVQMEKHQKIIFHCTGSHCVWRNRKVNSIVLDPSLSCLRKEIFITKLTIESRDKKDITNRINLDFLCTFEKRHPLKVILTVTNQHSNYHIFKEFEGFAKCKLVGIIEQTLIHMQQFNKCY